MQIKLLIDDFDEDSSILSWIIDYYFTEIFAKQILLVNKSIQPKNIIGSCDMWTVYRTIQPELSMIEFENLCKNKLKKINDNQLMENYNKYLNRCGLIDIIDLIHQCQLDSVRETITFSIKNIKSPMDRLVFQYLLELSSTSCEIYDTKTKLTTIETSENILKLIDNEKPTGEESINDLKHTLCTYLSLLLDTRNEHALIHCLLTSERVDLKRNTIVELQSSSKNASLTLYQNLLSFLRRKELTSTRASSLQYENDKILENYHGHIKEFFDFIEQLRMIIEENECSTETFRKLLQMICKQLRKNASFNQTDSVIEELCQCFQTIIPLMNCSSPIRSASSGATLAGRRFFRSIAYLCAKQTIDLPIHHDGPSGLLPEQVEVNHSSKSRYICHSNPIRKYRSLDLSIIHETSFESDPIIEHKPIVKRQPLREIDVNSFNIEQREIECEKFRSQNPIVFSLISEGDKENHPMITRKRSSISTKHDLLNKKHKKTNIKSPEAGQTMITSFFQSTS